MGCRRSCCCHAFSFVTRRLCAALSLLLFVALGSRTTAQEASAADQRDEHGFHHGTATPRGGWQGAAATRALHEVALLVGESHAAFDSGDMTVGRRQAREAVRRLQQIEHEETKKGRARVASRLAEQRGRVHEELLGELPEAQEALADALAADPGNQSAGRALRRLLDLRVARAGADKAADASSIKSGTGN